MAERPNWDRTIEIIEGRYMNGLWKQVRSISSDQDYPDGCLDEWCEDTLDLIEDEKKRVDPANAVDHEEVWWRTGQYRTKNDA